DIQHHLKALKFANQCPKVSVITVVKYWFAFSGPVLPNNSIVDPEVDVPVTFANVVIILIIGFVCKSFPPFISSIALGLLYISFPEITLRPSSITTPAESW